MPDKASQVALGESIASLLRLDPPARDVAEDAAADCLNRLECGGYLYRLWQSAGRLGDLTPGWAAVLKASHRKTVLDNLEALAEFRLVGRLLVEENLPFVLMKGGAYLINLYDDPGERMLTDIDLFIRRGDVRRLARRLRSAGYEAVMSDVEFRRFEVASKREGGCRFEFHWWLGRPLRTRVPQEAIWQRAVPDMLEGVACRRLATEDAILYHVAHQAEHCFGPSLKWTIDLREMLRRWEVDVDTLLDRAAEWRLRTALDLALRHLEKLFAGSAPTALREGIRTSPWRRHLLRGFLSDDPLQLFAPPRGTVRSSLLRGLLIDSPIDALKQGLRVLVRPVAQRLGWGMRLDSPEVWSD